MHLKKHGFTLIELLAVILILGIISSIAIQTSFKIVEEIKYNSYLESYRGFEKALEQYLSFKEDKLPTTIGETTVVELDELIEDGRIKKIANPYGKGYCTGYALITKLDSGNNDINSHLICNQNVTTINDDKLIAHYKFEEMQEPTKNLAVSKLVAFNDMSLIDKDIDENGYQKYGISGTWTLGDYQYIIHFKEIQYPLNLPYSASVKIKTNVPEKFKSFGSLIVENDHNLTGARKELRNGENSSFSDYIHSKNIMNPVYIFSSPKSNGMTFNPDTDFVYFKDLQIEQKSYTTEYTPNERTGIIKNYAKSNKSITLDLNKTPKWEKNGTYFFNGVDKQILIPSPNLTENRFTYSMWLNSSSKGTKTTTLLTPQSVGYDQYLNYDYDYGTLGVVVSEYANGPNLLFKTSKNAVKNDEWNYITLIMDKNRIQIYVNGVKKLDQIATFNIPVWAGNWSLGYRGTNTITDLTKRYYGYVDNIKIYGRILNDNEILTDYLQTKKKYEK